MSQAMEVRRIEVREADGPVTIEDRQLPQRGTFIVPMDQPAHRFVRNLLDPDVPMDEAFVQRQIVAPLQFCQFLSPE